MANSKIIVLASNSRDRKELFEKAGIPFEKIISDYEEDQKASKVPEELVVFLAKGKMEAVKSLIMTDPKYSDIRKSNFIIIGADTVVVFNDQIIGKAKSKDHAFKILKKLSGKKHILLTGVALFDSETNSDKAFYDSTEVTFMKLSDEEIEDYLTNCDEYKERAGAYSLRERASLFIEKVVGSPSNVIGIPIDKIYRALKEFGVKILNIPMNQDN